jgi:hypothetical protein
MKQEAVSKALADVELIKGIMQRTSLSLAGFSRVLLWWGGAWLAVVLVQCLLSSPLVAVSPQVVTTNDNRTLLTAFGLLLAAFAVLVVGVAMGISTYRQAIRDQAVSTLTRGLVSVWGVVLLISFVFPLVFAVLFALQHLGTLAPLILQQSLGAASAAGALFSGAGLFTPYAHAMEIWLFALALYTTRAMTRLAFPGWLGLGYLLIGLCYPLLGAWFGNVFYPGPYALLALGVYLETRRRKEGA